MILFAANRCRHLTYPYFHPYVKMNVMHSSCTHHALIMHSSCTHHALIMHSSCTHHAHCACKILHSGSVFIGCGESCGHWTDIIYCIPCARAPQGPGCLLGRLLVTKDNNFACVDSRAPAPDAVPSLETPGGDLSELQAAIVIFHRMMKMTPTSDSISRIFKASFPQVQVHNNREAVLFSHC